MLVPLNWHIEMANILGLKLRDGNISRFQLDQALDLFHVVDVQTGSVAAMGSIQLNLDRVVRFQLAAYDALYLEPALTTGSPLATYDGAMIRAARQAGVTVLTAP